MNLVLMHIYIKYKSPNFNIAKKKKILLLLKW